LSYSREIAAASAKRDAAVKELNLQKRASDLWATLEAIQPTEETK
jgi:hypothetical protein